MIPTHRGDPRRGFSLIEVLVAMAIFSIGAASALALLAAAAASHKRSIDGTRAALVAESVLGAVQARYGPGAEPAEIEKAVAANLPAAIDGYTWELTIVRPGEDPAKRKAPAVPDKPPPSSSKRKTIAPPRPSPAPPAGGDGGAGGWTTEEILVRVTIGWFRSGQSVTRSFDTILLPRPMPVGSPKAKG